MLALWVMFILIIYTVWFIQILQKHVLFSDHNEVIFKFKLHTPKRKYF